MSKLFKHLQHGGTALFGSLSYMILGLVRIKFLAAFFGPVGVGQIGLVSNFIELCGTVISAGFAGALNRELPKANDSAGRQKLSSIAVLFAAGVGAILVIPMTMVFFWLSEGIELTPLLFVLIALGILAVGFQRLLGGFYQGYRMSKNLMQVMIAGGITNIVFVITLSAFGVTNYALYAVATPVLFICASLIFGFRKMDWSLSRTHLKDSKVLRRFLAIAGPILLTTLMVPLTLYYLRSFTERELGAVELGLIQPGLQFVALSSSLFAAFAGMTIVRWDQSGEKAFARSQILLLAAAIALPLAAMAFLFNADGLMRLSIKLLYTNAFLAAAQTVPYFLTAEAMRMGGFFLNQTFISKGYNWFTLAPRAGCMITIIAALHVSDANSILDVAKAYMLGHVSFLIISIALFLLIQFKSGRTSSEQAS